MQLTQFELFYRIITDQVLRKKSKFEIKKFHAACLCLLELLYVVRAMNADTSDATNRQNAKILLANIFRHDITRYLQVGFQYCLEGLCKDEVLITLVEVQGVFFELMENYSRGRILTLKTAKLVRKKKRREQKKK